MTSINYIKESPITGITGLGGGATGLGVFLAGGATATEWYGDRALVFGGTPTGSFYNKIDYYDITSTGNASDFGDTTQARGYASACGSGILAAYGGGISINTIDYVTVSTTANAQDWGDLTTGGSGNGAASSIERGLWFGGWDRNNIIDYITWSSTGNAVDFGDLSTTHKNVGASSNGTKAAAFG